MWKVSAADIAAVLNDGRVALEMKSIGRPIGQNDITIAAIEFTLGDATVVTIRPCPACAPRTGRNRRESNRRSGQATLGQT